MLTDPTLTSYDACYGQELRVLRQSGYALRPDEPAGQIPPAGGAGAQEELHFDEAAQPQGHGHALRQWQAGLYGRRDGRSHQERGS